MFDRHYHIQDEHSRVEAARINAMSQEKFSKQLKDISEAEIKSKDRVDITLAEYERLKSDLRRYEEKSRRLEAIVAKLGIPDEVIDAIDISTIAVETCDDPMHFVTHYRIRFIVDEYLGRKLKGL